MKKACLLFLMLMFLSGCTSQVSITNTLPETSILPASAQLTDSSPEISPTPAIIPSSTSSAQTATPSPSLVPSPESTAIMYEQEEYRDKKAGFRIKYPKGWEVSNPDGEFVRFSGHIVNGSSGYAFVSVSSQKYSDLTEYDDYAKGIVEDSNKDRDVSIVQSAFIFTDEDIMGRHVLISAVNKNDNKDFHVYYYFFLPLGNKVYKVVCFSNGPDFNTVYKAYRILMSSLKN